MRDLTGQKFHRFTVLSFSHEEDGIKYWLCKCDCGVVKPIRRYCLGYIKSCGCYRQGRILTRGQSNTKENRAYHGMISSGKIYGLEICERWRNSYEHFLADMGMAPSPAHVFARIDKRRSFNPDNCKWATKQEARVFRKTIKLAEAGSTHTLSLRSVIKHAPSFFLALPDEARREVLRLVFTFTPENKGCHSAIFHFPSWQCRECRNEVVAMETWGRLMDMKGKNLEHLTIGQALLDLSIVRVLSEQHTPVEPTEGELEAALKKRAFEDFLFLSPGPASRETFEELWASKLREQYLRLQKAKQAIRNAPPSNEQT